MGLPRTFQTLPPALARRYRRRLAHLVLARHAERLECMDTWLTFCGTGA